MINLKEFNKFYFNKEEINGIKIAYNINMKRKLFHIILALAILFSISACSSSKKVILPEKSYIHASVFKFYLYDGTVIEGDFQGIEGKNFYILSGRTLYITRKNSIKSIKDKEEKSITKQIIKYEHILDIEWNKVNNIINLSSSGSPDEINLPYPINLKSSVNKQNQIELFWQVRNYSKKNSNKFLGCRIDRKIGTGLWELAIDAVSEEDTTWVDTTAPDNQLIFYRISSLHDKQITAYDQMNSFSNVTRNIIWNDGQIKIEPSKFKFGKTDVETEINYEFYISPYEVSNRDYCSMLNFALPRDYLVGDFFKNKTVKNALGTSKELLDLDDKDCKIYYNNGKFEVSKGFEDLPVTEVTWYGAVFYCNIFSEYAAQFSVFKSVYDLKTWSLIPGMNNYYRLPFESEIESVTIKNEANRVTGYVAKVDDQKLDKTNNGIFALAGNVSEWVYDYYHTGNVVSNINYVANKKSRFKVVKGSAFTDKISSGIIRKKIMPKQSLNNVGFRLVKITNANINKKISSQKRPTFMWEDLRFKNYNN